MPITDNDLNKKQLSSLLGEWYTSAKFIKENANFLCLKFDAIISFLQTVGHEMIENRMIKEDKPSFPVANSLITFMSNLSTRP